MVSKQFEEVEFDDRYLHDGHHRYVAAKRLGIPVKVKGYY